MNERIIIDCDNLYTDIGVILDELRVIRSDPEFVHIIGDEINRIKDWEISLKKRINEPFNAIIIGDFKRGKSTLVNALLGSSIVPVNVLPETATINKISYGEDNSCTAILKNGKKAKLDIRELNRKELEKVMMELPAEIEYVEISVKNELLKEIAIIDTPGIGDIFKMYDEQVTEYLKNADAVIYVASAKSPLSQTEQNFISAAVLPQSFSRIFVVLNMIDCLENIEDIEKITALTTERTKSITPNADVFPVSALDEYCRLMDMERPVPSLSSCLENNFEYLRTSLQTDIVTQKDIIKTMRIVTLSNYMFNDITNRINLLLAALNSNINNLSGLEDQYQNENSILMKSIQKEISSISLDVDEMYHEANGWIFEFMSRIRTEINSVKDKADAALLQKHFQFYMIEKIKTAIIACTTQHQKQITEKLKESAKSISLDVTAVFGGIDTRIAESITDISWTNLDSAMLAADFILGSVDGLNLGPIVMIGQAITGLFRQKEISKRQHDFLDPVLQNFDSITDEVHTELKSVYEKIKKSAISKLDNIYNIQIEQSLSAIKQAKQVLSAEEMKKADIVNHLNRTLNNLNELKELLKKYE